MAKRNFSAEDVRTMVREFGGGSSVGAIAKHFRCHHSVVRRVLEETRSSAAGVRHNVSEARLTQLRARYENSTSAKLIAEAIGCTVPTAIAKLRSVGTPIRGRGRPVGS